MYFCNDWICFGRVIYSIPLFVVYRGVYARKGGGSIQRTAFGTAFGTDTITASREKKKNAIYQMNL